MASLLARCWARLSRWRDLASMIEWTSARRAQSDLSTTTITTSSKIRNVVLLGADAIEGPFARLWKRASEAKADLPIYGDRGFRRSRIFSVRLGENEFNIFEPEDSELSERIAISIMDGTIICHDPSRQHFSHLLRNLRRVKMEEKPAVVVLGVRDMENEDVDRFLTSFSSFGDGAELIPLQAFTQTTARINGKKERRATSFLFSSRLNETADHSSSSSSAVTAAAAANTSAQELRSRLQEALARLDDQFLLSISGEVATEKSFLSAIVRVFRHQKWSSPPSVIPVLFDAAPSIAVLPFLLPPPPPLLPGHRDLQKRWQSEIVVLDSKCDAVDEGQLVSTIRFAAAAGSHRRLLRRGDVLLNLRSGREEVAAELFRCEEAPGECYRRSLVDAVGHGDVCRVRGFAATETGDVLLIRREEEEEEEEEEEQQQQEDQSPTIKSRKTALPPHPYLFKSCLDLGEPHQPNDKNFQKALRRLRLENPYLAISANDPRGRTTFSFASRDQIDRVWNELNNIGVPIRSFNPPSVICREVPEIGGSGGGSGVIARTNITLSSPDYRLQFCLEIGRVDENMVSVDENIVNIDGLNSVGAVVDPVAVSTGDVGVAAVIRRGISLALESGPLLGYPISGLRISVKSVDPILGRVDGEDAASKIAEEISKILRRSRVMRVHEPVVRLDIASPTTYSSKIIEELDHLGGRNIEIVREPLFNEEAIISKIPLGALPDVDRLLSVCGDDASYHAEFDRFAPEDVSRNFRPSFSEFMLAPILGLSVSELSKAARDAAGALPLPVVTLSEGAETGSFRSIGEYRRSMCHCLLHESAAKIAKDFGEMAVAEEVAARRSMKKAVTTVTTTKTTSTARLYPEIPMRVAECREEEDGTFVKLTADVPATVLRKLAVDENHLQLLTQQWSIALIKIYVASESRDGGNPEVDASNGSPDDDDNDYDNDRSILACATSFSRLERDDYIFSMTIRKSEIPPVLYSDAVEPKVQRRLPVRITYQRFSSLISDLRQFDALDRLDGSPLAGPLLRPNASFLVGSVAAAAAVAGYAICGVANDDHVNRRFNESQIRAIDSCVSMVSSRGGRQRRPGPAMALIHGPPGTGKSRVIIGILETLLTNDTSRRGILLCAPSNVAVDLLLIRILESGWSDGLKIVRWGRDDKISERTAHLKPAGSRDQIVARLNDADIVACTLNVAGTDVMTAVGRTKKVRCLIVDEASQGKETNAIIPIVNFRVDKLILVGDHLQLPPVLFSKFAQSQIHGRSMFERIHRVVDGNNNDNNNNDIVNLGAAAQFNNDSACWEKGGGGGGTLLLDTQYRMHPEIARFPANYVYAGRMKSNSSTTTTGARRGVDLPSSFPPYLFFDVRLGRERPSRQFPGSWYNEEEASAVWRIVAMIDRIVIGADDSSSSPSSSSSSSSYSSYTIGAITPYRSQMHVLRQTRDLRSGRNENNRNINDNNNNNINDHQRDKVKYCNDAADAAEDGDDDSTAPVTPLEIATVDAFQGGERDFIVFSAVRARDLEGGVDDDRRIGFLSNLQRLNVALTRAKRGLYIVGNADTLTVNCHWRALIEDARRRGKLVTVENLNIIDSFMMGTD